MFNYFIKGKIKLFSSKKDITHIISTSLFGSDLPLKKVFNNRSFDTKKILWDYLHLLVLFTENSKKNITDTVKNEILNIEVNNQTNNMINDVIKSFESSINNNNDNNEDSNPFKDIMKITNMITDKYQDDIESGEINLDSLLNNIQSQIPGMASLGADAPKKEKTIIDENFSTANVPVGKEKESGFNFGNMMKMVNSLGGGIGEDMGGLFKMMEKADKIETEEEANKLQEDMNKYLEEKLGVDISDLTYKDQEDILKE